MTARQSTLVPVEFLPALVGSLVLHVLIGVAVFAMAWPATPQTLGAISVQMVTLAELGLEAQAPIPAETKSKHLSVPERLSAPRESRKEAPAYSSKRAAERPALTKVSSNSVEEPLSPSADGSGTGGLGQLAVSGSGDTLAASRVGALRASYEQAIASRLEKVKRYPRRALMRNMEGSVLLYLEIMRHGAVRSQVIRESSGFSFFDEEVLAMVERAGGFPPFPAEIPDDSLAYTVPVSFRLTSR